MVQPAFRPFVHILLLGLMAWCIRILHRSHASGVIEFRYGDDDIRYSKSEDTFFYWAVFGMMCALLLALTYAYFIRFLLLNE